MGVIPEVDALGHCVVGICWVWGEEDQLNYRGDCWHCLTVQLLKSCTGKHMVQVIKCVCIKVHVYVLAKEGVRASMPVWGRRRQGEESK